MEKLRQGSVGAQGLHVQLGLNSLTFANCMVASPRETNKG